ncbi:hypothetical protein D9Q98_008234 [Chlorella vulgaris]|uniref:Thiaminase-2/PQQC domain-containing protein n=1 Tax=Chlorella vulgaris TaxID=3077 RepID=A0A9D4TGC6_CHLVU|nr:hypothetical protein D9Q98_008234 [Chlorella vulgaris]
MATSCSALLAANTEAWHDATHHLFLEACQNGSIQSAQFDAWLVQDGTFAREFARCLGALLTKAPSPSLDLLLGGACALHDELHWFASLSAERGLPTDAAPHPTCQRYTQFMENCSKQPYAVHAVVFWAIERAYNESWSKHTPGMAEPYRTYAQRWGSEGFSAYVGQLEALADEALAAASSAERDQAASLFRQVCELEREFWAMAYSAQ